MGVRFPFFQNSQILFLEVTKNETMNQDATNCGLYPTTMIMVPLRLNVEVIHILYRPFKT